MLDAEGKSLRNAMELTSDTSEELPSKVLYLTTWERYKGIGLEKVEHALAQEVCYYTDVVPEVETVS